MTTLILAGQEKKNKYLKKTPVVLEQVCSAMSKILLPFSPGMWLSLHITVVLEDPNSTNSVFTIVVQLANLQRDLANQWNAN